MNLKGEPKNLRIDASNLLWHCPIRNSPTTFEDNYYRCSTSVASNYRAACIAQSKASFISKLSIVIEEADESIFWLEFIIDENLLKKAQVEPLLKEAEELTAIFMTSRKTAINGKE